MSDDLEARDDALNQRILAIPADRVFRRSTIVIGFVVIMLALGLVQYRIGAWASDTHDVVTAEVPHLEAQVADRDHTIAQQNDIISQATDAILLLQKTLRDHGITPPDIVIRPKEEP